MPANKLNHLIVSWGIFFVLGAVVGYAMGRGSGAEGRMRDKAEAYYYQEAVSNMQSQRWRDSADRLSRGLGRQPLP